MQRFTNRRPKTWGHLQGHGGPIENLGCDTLLNYYKRVACDLSKITWQKRTSDQQASLLDTTCFNMTQYLESRAVREKYDRITAQALNKPRSVKKRQLAKHISQSARGYIRRRGFPFDHVVT